MAGPQLPDYLRGRVTKTVKEKLSESLGAGAPAYLSIEGDRFTLYDGSGNQQPVETVEKGVPYVDVVIIDSLERISKIYYGDRVYDPSVRQPPICWSDNGIAPSRNASEPQSPTCVSCQWFPWGSAVSKMDPTKKTKACQDYQKLALMVPGYDGIYLLRIPPNSLTPLREYQKRFNSTDTDPSDVVTRISFERGIRGTLNFRGVSFIEQETAVKRDEALLAHMTDTVVGRTDQPIGSLTQIGVQAANPAGQVAAAPSKLLLEDFQPPQTQAPAAAPQEAPAAPKARGRPRKEPAAAPATQAPFPTASGNSGIQAGAPPDQQMQKTMDDFFGPVSK